MIRVKVCGVSTLKELNIVEKSGADAVGFLVGQKHKAVGFISIKTAKELVKKSSPFINTVMVTHLEEVDEIVHLGNEIMPCSIQLHSDLSISKIKSIRKKLPHTNLIGKVSIIDEEAIERAKKLNDIVDAILLDSIDLKNDRVGGTGTTHNWNISREIVKATSVPVILAGGLDRNNVSEAINKVKPWGVDANSRLKSKSTGEKSKLLVDKFVEKAKGFTI